MSEAGASCRNPERSEGSNNPQSSARTLTVVVSFSAWRSFAQNPSNNRESSFQSPSTPVSTLPCPSRFSGLSRLVVDSTTRPLYQPQTIFKPHLNHLPTNIHRPIPNFMLWRTANCFLLIAVSWAECSRPSKNAACPNVSVQTGILEANITG